MTLLNAPQYDAQAEHKKKALLISVAALLVAAVLFTLAGFLFGHGWAFSNLEAEHKVNAFFNALEAKDYSKAYAIYTNDPGWKQHPAKHKEYPIDRFIEDWTTDSPANGPILSHHVDISKTDGSGTFGTGIIVAVRVNSAKDHDKKLFMYYVRKDGTLTWPAFHQLEY